MRPARRPFRPSGSAGDTHSAHRRWRHAQPAPAAPSRDLSQLQRPVPGDAAAMTAATEDVGREPPVSTLCSAHPRPIWPVCCTDSLHRADRLRIPPLMSAPSAPTDSDAPIAVAASTGSSRRPLSADEPRVHPPCRRHDESDAADQPDPSPSSSSSSATSTDSTRPSPASRLYRHALECILAFSDLAGLAVALRVSKEWLAAVGSMRHLALAWNCTSGNAQIQCVAASTLGRHISGLDAVGHGERLSASVVGIMAHRMPHLRRLHCSLPQLLGAGTLHFPA